MSGATNQAGDAGACVGAPPICGSNMCGGSRAGLAAVCDAGTWICPCASLDASAEAIPKDVSCGSCDPATSYCSAGIGPVSAAGCVPLPTQCGQTPSCACIKTDCSGEWTCTEVSGIITETCTLGGSQAAP